MDDSDEDERLGGDAVVYVCGTGIVAKRFFEEARLKAELSALLRVQGHPNVLGLLGFDEPSRLLWFPRFEEDLLRALLRGADVDAAGVSLSVLRALAHCEERGVVHNDVKPENVLLRGGGRGRDAVLADFSRSVVLPANETSTSRRFCGTPAYAAPEALLQGRSSYACDAWGAGCVLFVAVQRETPFEDNAATSPELEWQPDKWPPRLLAVARGLLETREAARLSARAAVGEMEKLLTQ